MLAEHSLILYAGLLGLLVFVLVGGSTARWARSAGSRSGRFKLQPSEFARHRRWR